jgi:hypothetical protein
MPEVCLNSLRTLSFIGGSCERIWREKRKVKESFYRPGQALRFPEN